MADAPSSRFVTPFEDSRRWRNVVRRPGDIVISASLGSATAWTQQIVASLLMAEDDKAAVWRWVDDLDAPIDRLVDELEATTPRRCLLTHSPADCIPFDESCRYLVVSSEWRDAYRVWATRWLAHAGSSDHSTIALSAAVTVEEWLHHSQYLAHVASWWHRRHAPNVLFIHHDDVASDPGAEVAQLVAFLDFSPTELEQLAVIDRCGLETDRRSSAPATSTEDERWYLAQIHETLSPAAALWIEQGSAACGQRPDQIGAGPAAGPDNELSHPVLSRVANQRANNSIDAIADRRVDEARLAGLFDNLALHGKPIPDIDRPRHPGWWANQFVAKERNKVKALELEMELRSAMPGLWRLETEAQVETEVQDLNDKIAAYNRVTTLPPAKPLLLAETLSTWRSLRRR